MLRPELLEKWNFISCQPKNSFISKKNEVSLYTFVDANHQKRDYIVKTHTSTFLCKREAEVLTHLIRGGLTVPKIIDAEDNFIVLEYIKGPTLLNWTSDREQAAEGQTMHNEVRQVLQNLADWLSFCYALLHRVYAKSMILGDVNFRNFIIADQIYGLDFEEYREGNPAEDIGALCAFALTYDPAFTLWKYHFVMAVRDIIAASLKLPWETVFAHMQTELERISSRRKTDYLHHEMVDLIKRA